MSQAKFLSKKSNTIACIHYAREFRDKKNAENDLVYAQINNTKVPVLLNGSCNFFINSSKSMNLDNSFKNNLQLNNRLYVVVPEIATILESFLTFDWQSRNATNSIMESISGDIDSNIYFALDVISDEKSYQDYVRIFDSHHSIYFYELMLIECMARLGIDISSNELDFQYEMREYLPDLASRFTNTTCESAFPTEKYLVKEERSENSLRGLWRQFKNSNSLLDEKLLLIGDSHSYSCLSPMFSLVFSQVDFIWANANDNYGTQNELVKRLSKSHDYIIEECTERFFLFNFCDEKAA